MTQYFYLHAERLRSYDDIVDVGKTLRDRNYGNKSISLHCCHNREHADCWTDASLKTYQIAGYLTKQK